MFQRLKRRAQMAIAKSFERDIDRFIQELKRASVDEVAAIVACAAHFRNALEAKLGWNLDHPELIVAVQDAGVAAMLDKLVQAAQAKDPVMARGLMVCLHSLRASQTPRMRPRGREMWAELGRGIPYARTAADNLELVLGLRLQVKGVERVPANLNPDQAMQPAA